VGETRRTRLRSRLRALRTRLAAAPSAAPAPAAATPERAPSAGRLVGLALLLAVLALQLWDPVPIALLRFQVLDTYQRLLPRAAPAHAAVVVVDIDEASLAAYGQWPWPRTRIALLIERLLAMGPAVVVVDVNFPEPDRLSPPLLADHLIGLDPASQAVLRALPGNDATLAAAIAKGPVVLAEAVLEAATEGAMAASPAAAMATLGDPRPALSVHAALLGNVPELAGAAAGSGINSFVVERDGVLRRLPLVFLVADELRPSLLLEAIRVARGADATLVQAEAGGMRGVTVDGLRVPTDREGRIWLHFAEPPPDRLVPAARVLAGEVAPGAIAGRYVIVGSTAAGLKDLRATPVAGAMPGVEILAQGVEMILAGEALHRPPAAVAAEILALLAIGLVVLVLVPRLGALANIGLALGLALLVIGGAWLAFASSGLLIDWSFPVLAGTALNGTLVLFKYADERRARQAAHLRLLLVDREMAAAREVQRSMLPTAFPERGTIRVFAEMWPALEVGGDLYDVFELPDGRIGVVVGDVAGKGMPAALFMAITRTVLKAQARLEPDAGACLALVNDALGSDNQASMFVTAFYGIVEPASGRMVYANGGHNPPLLRRRGGTVETLAGTAGLALGVLPDLTFRAAETRLDPGDALVLYSDGVTEAFDPAGGEFTTERLEALLADTAATAPEALVRRIVAEVRRFMAGAPQADDITCLVVTRLEDATGKRTSSSFA
jgi:adenylate cyclase